MRLSPLLLAATAALFAAGCSDNTTEPDRSLQVTTDVAPAAFRAGTAVTVTLTVENAGRQSRTIVDQPCADPFVVTTSAGAQVPPATRVCDLVVRPPRTVAPGERVVLTREWRGDVAGSAPSLGSGTLLAAGDYRLQGVVQAADDGTVYAGSTVTIRVLP